VRGGRVVESQASPGSAVTERKLVAGGSAGSGPRRYGRYGEKPREHVGRRSAGSPGKQW